MQITLKIFRFDPERDPGPHYDSYVLSADPADRVLDLLEQVRSQHDPSLAYRRACGHGVCGSDALRVNGRNVLACRLRLQQAGDNLRIEPLLGLPLIKDLIVDMEPFFAQYRAVQPWLVPAEAPPADGRERIQTPAERQRYDDTSRCILCAACSTACPVSWANPRFIGPAAAVNAHRFIFDTRDGAAAQRLKALGQPGGLWLCRTAFNCTTACPRGIHVTRAIAEIKRAMLKSAGS